jgi:hypothetical protein
MESDFSGYATKANLKCTDGRTIMPNAFQHQDNSRVPLVWQHGHNDPENVLGHAILENRDDGVYAYGFFNESGKAQHAKGLLEHQDINMMSIWANNLIERSGKVIHGAIREVSLVLSGANPGALIETVTIRHSDGDEYSVDDEAIIYTGLELELKHESGALMPDAQTVASAASANPDLTIQEIYDTMTDVQKEVLHYMVGEAIDSAQQSDIDENDEVIAHDDKEGITNMANVFEQNGKGSTEPVLSHSDVQQIVADASKQGSLRGAVENYALAHGITDIDILFPEAQSIDTMPEWFSRRTEWVNSLLGATRKSPFSRIKTLSADLTPDEARAKGYITGNLKKEEFFSVSKRITTPTTIYKKQKLDRDDMIDITDFDVVTWLKQEMRLMLDEELARAILVGDGRDVSDDDKINTSNIRPIAYDHELYTTVVNVNVGDASSSQQEVIDAFVLNRSKYKGTGTPNFYTTEAQIAKFLLMKDTLGRRIYSSLSELASELRVAAIIPVEVLESDPTIIGIVVNPVDYVVGADSGGSVSMFDDFDIDYNQYKYLIETRVCGALVKLKSAMVIKSVASNAVLVSPNAPAFVESTGVLTITNQTGVVYTRTVNGANPTVVNAAGSPYAAIAAGSSITITATPASGYYFATSDNDTWVFTRNA